MTSYDTMRQLYFSAYDMELYVRYESVAYFICKIKMPNTALLNDLTNETILLIIRPYDHAYIRYDIIRMISYVSGHTIMACLVLGLNWRTLQFEF